MIFAISNGNKRDSIIYTIKIIYRRDETMFIDTIALESF